MLLKKIFLILLLALTFPAKAQLLYVFDQTIPVEFNGKTLAMPWAGGFNSPQFNTMDLDGDHHDDLVIFDRTANKVITFINEKKVYRYAPEYEVLFPDDLDQWMLLRDFNCDGKKDIFTSDPFGMKAYVNTTAPGGNPTWRKFNGAFPILTIGFNGTINLQVNGTDIPAIDDVDGDGDLDILDARFVGIGSLEWHKNMSIENTGKCDSLQFKRVTQTWGNFEECNCGKYLFGIDSTCSKFGGRIKHASGKSSITIDFDNDGVRDLLFSEETCSNLYFMPNTGTPDSAVINNFTPFPTAAPLVLQIFPAPYYEDVDFDGVSDLIVASNVYTRNSLTINFQQSTWLYKNTGTSQLPVFTFVKNNFIQDQMIEVGDNAVPAFIDEDGDGDLDLFIGNYSGVNAAARLYFFQNAGTTSHPSFVFMTDDYGGLTALGLYNLRPQFADMNADGKTDLVFTATDLQTGLTSLKFIPNKSTTQLDLSGQPVVAINFPIDQSENILVVDVNRDGLNDFLVGRSTGSLEYWINNGPSGATNLALQNSTFLGLGISTDRQSLSMAAADLNADGKVDLLLGNQRGALSVIEDFRSADVSSTPQKGILSYNALTLSSNSTRLGGRIWPAVANLFDGIRPVIVAGNTLGGLRVLKNDEVNELPLDPLIAIYPNPVSKGEVFFIKADRNVSVQFVSALGQKFSDDFPIAANEAYRIPSAGLASGLYIARISVKGKIYTRKFIIY